MANISVKQLAKRVGLSAQDVLAQFTAAGMQFDSDEQAVSPEQWQALQAHIADNRKRAMVADADQAETAADAGAAKKKGTLSLKKKTLKLSSSSRTEPVIVHRPKHRQPKQAALVTDQVPEKLEDMAPAPEILPAEAPAAVDPMQDAVVAETTADTDQVTESAESASVHEVLPEFQSEQTKAQAEEMLPAEDAAVAGEPEKKAKRERLPGGIRRRPAPPPVKRTVVKQASELKATPLGPKASPASKKQAANKRDVTRKAQRREVAKPQHAFEMPTTPQVHEVKIPDTISVAELAQRMSVKAAEVIKYMMGLGAMVTINQVIDQDTAALVVEEMGHTPVMVSDQDIETALLAHEGLVGEATARPPVVTIMGHVDHGKTTLLDAIRRTRVTAGEAGGITQHIGAYQVSLDKGKITFLDTPGHEAFTAMRARGAECTDIVILVVAADDGVKPQTIEAIQHAKTASVPIVVAVNKMDKEGADPEHVKTALSHHAVISEEWGGDVIFQPISAKTGMGLEALLSDVLLQAEMLELKAVATGPMRGVVVESRLDKGRGPVVTILVQQGTLKVGEIVVAGREYGRVRALLDDLGRPMATATPGTPVEVLGLSGVPSAGDEALAVTDERKAREITTLRHGKHRDAKLAKQQSARMEQMLSKMGDKDVQTLNVLLKADVHGSAEAIRESLLKLSNDEVKVNVVAANIGGISESDVNLALASQAVLLGFNVRADKTARALAEHEGVHMKYYSVIYELIDDVKQALTGMLAPVFEEKILGIAEVRDVFKASKMGQIAGCMVTEGLVRRQSPIRVLRDNVVIYEGELESLRRFKDDVNEVRLGTECGIAVLGYEDVKVGDQIESYVREKVERVLA